jgi:hypothetical protein
VSAPIKGICPSWMTSISCAVSWDPRPCSSPSRTSL